MGTTFPIQTDFTAGEITPKLRGRVDLQKYNKGLEVCENFIIQPYGGCTHRPGTMFVQEVKDHSKYVRLIPFQFSVVQTYMIQMGDSHFRFYRDGGVIVEPDKTITAITAASPGVVTSTAHGYSNDEQVILSGISGMIELNQRTFVVKNVTTNTFELYDLFGNAVDTSGYTAYSSGGVGNRIYEIAHPYAQADLEDVKFTQSADVLYLDHPDYAPRKLSRTGHTSWSISIVDFQDGPYLLENATATTMTASAATGSVTVTASSVNGINNNTGFQTTDVGRHIRIKNGSNWAWGKITARASTTAVTVSVQTGLGGSFPTSATASWRLGAWSDTTGWPYVPAFHENRLWHGGNNDQPDAIWGSKSSDFENMEPTQKDATVGDDNAITYRLSSDQVNAIRWMRSGRRLGIGTSSGEWTLGNGSGSSSDPITPNNVKASEETNAGAFDISQAIKIDNATIFIQYHGKRLHEWAYRFSDDAWNSPDLTILAEHISANGLIEIAYAREPNNIIWAPRTDGQLVGCTYIRAQDVIAWHRHIIGGSYSTGDAVVESAAVIRADGYDQLWLEVLRTIDGNTVRYVEYMTNTFDAKRGDSIEDVVFMDSALTYSGSSTDTVTGLWHLEGETVQVLADGSPVPSQVVANGTIIIDRLATKINVGLYKTATMQNMQFEIVSQTGTSQGRVKRINQATLRFLETVGGQLGPDENNLDQLLFRTAGDAMDQPVPLYSGDKRVPFPSDYDEEARIMYVQDQPLPATVLMLVAELAVYG